MALAQVRPCQAAALYETWPGYGSNAELIEVHMVRYCSASLSEHEAVGVVSLRDPLIQHGGERHSQD